MYYFILLFLIFSPIICVKAYALSQEEAIQKLNDLEAQKKEAEAELEANKNSFFSLFDPYAEKERKRLEKLILELEQEKIPAAKKQLKEINLGEQKGFETLSSFSCIDPLPIADWLNISQIQPFFKRSSQPYVEIQPYAFSSDFHLHHLPFKLETLGLSIQGGLNVSKQWMIGGGFGYFYSNLDYSCSFKEGQINSVYGGPFVAYLFEKGYAQLRFLGAYNSYSREDKNSHGWDFDTQFEGGVKFEPKNLFGPRFFIQPNIKLDYLSVFQDENKPTFFSSRLALQFLKEFVKGEKGILTPSLSLGWVCMQPLSHKTHLETYKSFNQTYVGATLTGLHKRGIALSCGFEGYFGKLYPVYAYNLKLSLDL